MKLVSNTRLLLAALFVAGLGFSLTAPAHAAAAPTLLQDASQGNAVSVAGSWTLSFTAPNGDAKQATLTFQQSGSQLSGSFQGQRGSAPLTGMLDGSKISVTIKAHGRELSFKGTVDGSKMSGTASDGNPWSAARQ